MYTQLYQIKKHLNLNEEWHEDDEYLVSLAEVCETIVERNIDVAFKKLEDGDGDIPAPLQHAILLLIGNFYANRESIAFVQSASLPHSFQYLIDLYRDYRGPTE